MALTCPRCGTDVPTEALYCPYCSLPKPKRGFTEATEGQPDEPCAPVEHSNPPAQVRKAAKPRKIRAKRSSARSGRPQRQLRLSVVSVAALVAFFSVAIYTFVVPMVYSEQAEPKTVTAALDRLRKTPSSEPGLTIDARLTRQLETARRVGNLVAYQGWTVRPIKGSRTKVVLSFSYEEVGEVHQSAEWIADLSDGSFSPQSDLATEVSRR